MPLVPLRRYPEPAYPTRRLLLADPGILQRHIPPAWRRLAGVGGILAFFLHAEALAGEAAPAVPANAAAVTVAPIFKHGEGRGSFGCVAVSPPVFLSEEEALAVITEELGRKGVTLAQRAVVWADTPVPPRVVERFIPKGQPESKEIRRTVESGDAARPLVVDAVDPAKGIAVEFIAREDYDQLGGVDPYHGRIVREADAGEGRQGFFASSVSSYDFADAATYLAGKAAQHKEPGRRWLGVFYDPMDSAPGVRPAMPPGLDDAGRQAWREKMWAEREAAARALAVANLRLQVQDFVAWLAGQGAL